MTTPSACDLSDFCYELSGGADTEFRRTYPDGPESRILMETSKLVAMADMSPIVRGHCLIAPRLHRLSIAEVARSDAKGLKKFIAEFLDCYLKVYSDITLFEHGSGSTVNPSACIVHAHLHVVPTGIDTLMPQMSADGLLFDPVDGWDSLGRSTAESPYYLLGDQSRLLVAIDAPRLPKQYFRVVMGRLLNYDSILCDWAACVRRDLFQQTIADLDGCTREDS